MLHIKQTNQTSIHKNKIFILALPAIQRSCAKMYISFVVVIGSMIMYCFLNDDVCILKKLNTTIHCFNFEFIVSSTFINITKCNDLLIAPVKIFYHVQFCTAVFVLCDIL